MKHIIYISILVVLIASCEKKEARDPGTGFEIYLTEIPYSHNLEKDYSLVDFDTISLQEEPILFYSEVISYDTTAHKLTIGISHDSLRIGDAGVYGRMFVVTIDKEPVYCGFKWPVLSSVPCNWVFIEEPYEELDHLADNEIVISFSSYQYPDPRLDSRIVDRLKKDGKLE